MGLLRKDPWNLIRIIPAKENDLPSRRQKTQQSSPSFSPLRIKIRIRQSRLSVGLTHQPDSEIINEEIQPSFFLLVHWHGPDVTRIDLGTGGPDPLHL